MSIQTLRNRYVGDNVTTASPARLVTMLYDRLVRDLLLSEQSLEAGDTPAAHEQLVHAQAIVMELQSGLDPSKWEGGPGLASLYVFLLQELIGANVAKDAERVRACRRLVEPLQAAWHEAATSLAAPIP